MTVEHERRGRGVDGQLVAELLAAWRVLDAHERAQVIRAVIELLDERRDLASKDWGDGRRHDLHLRS